MEYGLIGEHLSHSFSKNIHEKLAPYTYELHELRPDELDSFMRSKEFKGINVTIPYKQAVIPYLDEISGQARSIGAVNTIVNRNGKLCGFNTDYFGMKSMIERPGIEPAGKKVLILGTGGTSRTAKYVAESLGASSVIRVSRTAREGAVTYEEAARDHRDARILINTTPCGMYPAVGDCPADLRDYPELEAVADVIYNPLRTNLVLEAMEKGIPAEGGLFMLTAQAVRAAELFHGTEYPAGTAEKIYRELLREKENMVLIGMPGSGKSTVSAVLQARTGRPAADTDGLIEQKAGKTIPEIFRENGEKVFRNLESEVIGEVSVRGGQIIATGGGAVLRPENVRALKRNGRLILLERPAGELIPTADRPLADTQEKMDRLRREREPIYRAAADCTVQLRGTPEDAATETESRWLK